MNSKLTFEFGSEKIKVIFMSDFREILGKKSGSLKKNRQGSGESESSELFVEFCSEMKQRYRIVIGTTM